MSAHFCNFWPGSTNYIATSSLALLFPTFGSFVFAWTCDISDVSYSPPLVFLYCVFLLVWNITEDLPYRGPLYATCVQSDVTSSHSITSTVISDCWRRSHYFEKQKRRKGFCSTSILSGGCYPLFPPILVRKTKSNGQRSSFINQNQIVC